MITGKELNTIKTELLKLFPEVEKLNSTQEDSKEAISDYQNFYLSFCLYLSKGKKVVLKFSKDYLEQNSLEDFRKHLQRNIYYISKSNLNKTIYLLKNFEIEISNESEEFNYA